MEELSICFRLGDDVKGIFERGDEWREIAPQCSGKGRDVGVEIKDKGIRLSDGLVL